MYRAKIPAFWTQLEGAASQMPLSCHRPRNYVTHFTVDAVSLSDFAVSVDGSDLSFMEEVVNYKNWDLMV